MDEVVVEEEVGLVELSVLVDELDSVELLAVVAVLETMMVVLSSPPRGPSSAGHVKLGDGGTTLGSGREPPVVGEDAPAGTSGSASPLEVSPSPAPLSQAEK